MTEMKWQNEPDGWTLDGSKLTIECANGTDFWRKTHYGFDRSSGHFYYRVVPGDFRVSTKIEGPFLNQYDQAGLMLWLDEDNWLKAGVEFVDGKHIFSVVVTHGFSDWSIYPCDNPEAMSIHMIRRGDSVTVETVEVDGTSKVARLAYMDPMVAARVGPMACAPSGSGFSATLSGWEIHSDLEPH
jgi:regulation of enolase protein 1 (concanavalin A-like superfamily)